MSKNDHTSTRRANKRLTQCQEAARRDGFETYSAAITSWLKGECILIKNPAPQSLERFATAFPEIEICKL